MSEHQHLELRVLSGLQAGARLPLDTGTYLVGSDERFVDVVIKGHGVSDRHFDLMILEGESQASVNHIKVHSEHGIFIGSRQLTSGMDKSWPNRVPMLLGRDTLLILDVESSEWPSHKKIQSVLAKMKSSHGLLEEDLILYEPSEQSMGSSSQDHQQEESIQEGEYDPDNLEDSFSGDPESVLPSSKKDGHEQHTETLPVVEHAMWPVWLAIGLMTLVGMIVLLLLTGVIGEEQQTESPRSSSVFVSEKELHTIRQAINQVLPDAHVQVTTDSMGKALVSGYVSYRPELEKIKMVLQKLPLSIKLKVWVDEELRIASQSVIQEDLSSVRIEDVKDGVVTLAGAAESIEAVDRIRNMIKTGVMGVQRVESKVATADDLREILKTRLSSAGLIHKIKFEPTLSGVKISGDLDRQDFNRFEILIKDFIREFGTILPIEAKIKTAAPVLPFAIQAAISGDAPFIVTSQGEKVLLGGYIRGYRLKSVDDQKIVLSGPEEVVIER